MIPAFPANFHANETEKEQNQKIMELSDQQNNQRPFHLDLIWQSNIRQKEQHKHNMSALEEDEEVTTKDI